jgi:hypothetical protein
MRSDVSQLDFCVDGCVHALPCCWDFLRTAHSNLHRVFPYMHNLEHLQSKMFAHQLQLYDLSVQAENTLGIGRPFFFQFSPNDIPLLR